MNLVMFNTRCCFKIGVSVDVVAGAAVVVVGAAVVVVVAGGPEW